jgi:sugar/nucleoside kinase (ribokinase family)
MRADHLRRVGYVGEVPDPAGGPAGGPDDLHRGPEPLDVVAVGSALVDVIMRVTEADLDELGLVKGSMSLVDRARAETIQTRATEAIERSGGSAANTAVGVAKLGGAAGFVGKVVDDRLGKLFTQDLRSNGVTFEPVADRSQDRQFGTGRCLVLVTEDAERTMATYLGAATTIEPADVPLSLFSRAQVVYLEGYLWDMPSAVEVMHRVIDVGHGASASIALSLSDPFCVQRHRRQFLELVRDDLDILFGNEEELRCLFDAPSFEDALDAALETGLLVAATRGPRGSVVTTPHGPVPVDAHPVRNLVDTTGAGDLYAAGFLFGLTHGADPSHCARLGGLCASEVISHLGARPEAELRSMAAGLL